MIQTNANTRIISPSSSCCKYIRSQWHQYVLIDIMCQRCIGTWEKQIERATYRGSIQWKVVAYNGHSD